MMKRAFFSVATAATLLLATPAAGAQERKADPEAAPCRAGEWPTEVSGRPPSFRPGAPAGVYLWQTPLGWRLRVTHPGEHRVVFQGQITSGARIESVGKRLETRGQDTLVATNDHHVTFSFRNGGHIDGFDFTMTCATGFELNGTIDGQALDSERVFIGAGGRHPARVPFRTERG